MPPPIPLSELRASNSSSPACTSPTKFRDPKRTDRFAMNSDPMTDLYWKLRPSRPTPPEDVCHCDAVRNLILCDTLTENPFQCLACRGEVAPERIGFDEQLADAIAHWRGLHRSLYLLWLDSGEYESWASDRLLDRNGRVNVLGREIVDELNRSVRTYYSWFSSTEVDDRNSSSICPCCRATLEWFEGRSLQKCDVCSILV